MAQANQPPEVLFEFARGADGVRVRCELQETWDRIVAVLLFNNVPVIAQRFDTRAAAVEWATLERHAHESESPIGDGPVTRGRRQQNDR